ncbi:MAG: MFS transporter [Planctomycetes bacterium]|nr:MFS transporter [Planctomycetota bacterium]
MRGLVMLAAAIFVLNLGTFFHMTANVPFLHNVIHANEWQQGWLESVRESCGILSFFVIALFIGFSEPRLSTFMLLMAGGGLAAYFVADSIWQVMVFSLVWSFGLHMWMPLVSSMQLGLAVPGREGRTLGILRSVGAVGVLAGLGAVWLLRVLFDINLSTLFLLAGTLVAIGALPVFFVPDIRLKSATRMKFHRVFSKRYRVYCGIELLDGMRKQIFMLFAVLVFVREYGKNAETIAALMFASQFICTVLAPLAGRFVDRFGERPILTAYFSSVAAFFILFTLLRDIRALYAVYVIDNSMVALRVAVPTYANRIALPGERTQLLAMGVTMNHVGAVTLPLVGGFLYAKWGYRFPFYCGALAAAASVVLTWFISVAKPPVSSNQATVRPSPK